MHVSLKMSTFHIMKLNMMATASRSFLRDDDQRGIENDTEIFDAMQKSVTIVKKNDVEQLFCEYHNNK